MRDISFFSEDRYLFLPSKGKPKVALAVGNNAKAKNAHELYNPFSSKGKILKWTSRFLFTKLNSISAFIFATKPCSKSNFIEHLENKFNTSFTASIYFATAKDKVVLQLQAKDSIFGYLKFPLNASGVKNINTENRANLLLSQKLNIQPAIDYAYYEGIPYIILPEIKGSIGHLNDTDIEGLANQFNKKTKLRLEEHQRVKDLYVALDSLGLITYKSILDGIVKRSTEYYHEAYEHGDFAPWNIVASTTGLTPFDFEFFIENGTEYLDLIKYHFQVGRLLQGKNQNELSKYLFQKIRHNEVKELISLFLILEIVRLKKGNEPYEFHHAMLKHTCE